MVEKKITYRVKSDSGTLPAMVAGLIAGSIALSQNDKAMRAIGMLTTAAAIVCPLIRRNEDIDRQTAELEEIAGDPERNISQTYLRSSRDNGATGYTIRHALDRGSHIVVERVARYKLDPSEKIAIAERSRRVNTYNPINFDSSYIGKTDAYWKKENFFLPGGKKDD